MATTYPQTPERLREISGAGQVKLERYGGPFLAVIREYCTAHGLKERPKVVTTSVALTGSLAKRRFVEVGELFAGGMSIEQLQAQYGVQRSTIVNHLANYLREGGAVDVERVRATSRLSPEEQQRVFAVFDELGPHALNPVFEALGGTIPYDELHVLRVVYVATETPSDS
jgi:ATP-dependent DNA helicase RecQ